MSTPAHRAREIFLGAVEITEPERRVSYLEAACAGDAELRRRVDALLAAHERPESLLDRAAVEARPTFAYADGETAPHTDGPDMVIGPYTLIEPIGEGGMGIVYLAEQAGPIRRRVALKVIKPGMDSAQVLARFEVERQALALMDHPNIAKVHDAGTTPAGRPYFVMERVEGIPITRYCDDARLTPRQRLELFIPVCQAIQHAHQKGIIHRDIKPSNILVTLVDGRPVPKVIDFGIAKATDPRLTERTLFTRLGAIVGTPEYMSPEQAGASPDIDTRTDVYALGVLLYELLTGTTPLDRETQRQAAFDEVLKRVREEEPPKPSTRLSGTNDRLPSVAAVRGTEPARLAKLVRGDLDWVVMKALEKDRARRYETANGLARDVQRYLDGDAVEASPPSSWYRLGKFARRNRVVLTATVLIALSLVAGAAASAWQATLARRARVEAITQRDRARIAEADALARRDEAEAKSRLARRAVDTMYSQVADKWLLNQPGTTRLQREFLEEALKFYQEFARERGSDPEIRSQAAQAYFRVGNLQGRLDRLEQAEEAYRRAISLQESLDDPGLAHPEYQYDLAGFYTNLAFLMHVRGRVTEAEEAVRRVIRLYEQLVGRYPDREIYRDRLLRFGYSNLGAILAGSGKEPEAEAVLSRALGLADAMADAHPGKSPYRKTQVNLLHGLGELRSRANRTQEALQAFRRQAELCDQLAAEDPGPSRFRSDVATAHHVLAGTLGRIGECKGAEKEYTESQALWRRQIADFSDENANRLGLARGLLDLATLRDHTGRPREGEALEREALTIAEGLVASTPSRPDYRVELGRALIGLAAHQADRGELRQSHESLRRAISQLTSALEPNPRDPGPLAQLSEAHLGLADVLVRLGDHAAAAQAAERALADSSPGRDLARAIDVLSRCAPPAERDPRLASAARRATAGSYRARARGLLREATDRTADDPRTLGSLARLLADPADPSIRDPSRAMDLARRATDRAPKNGEIWGARGVACYRTGDWRGAVTALEKSMELRCGGDGSDWLYLAMAHWNAGDRKQARSWLDKAASWIDQNKPGDERLGRLRAEAATLLAAPEEAGPANTGSNRPKKVHRRAPSRAGIELRPDGSRHAAPAGCRRSPRPGIPRAAAPRARSIPGKNRPRVRRAAAGWRIARRARPVRAHPTRPAGRTSPRRRSPKTDPAMEEPAMKTRTTKRRRPALESLEGRTLMTAGALDTTFGGTGAVTTTVATDYGGGDDQAYGLAIQPDLKTLASGLISETVNGVSTDYNAVVRYNTDGSLDTTFGSGGIVTLPGVAGGTANINGTGGVQVQLQSNGQIVVAGTVVITQGKGKKETSTYELTVYRLNPNGSLDTTFNGTGQATLSYIPFSLAGESGLAIQADGKILIGDDGNRGIPGAEGFLVARLNANGSRDTTFGPNGQGYVDTAVSNGAGAFSNSLTLDGSGNILVGGDNYDATVGTHVPALVRYTAAGLPDPNFGTNGEVLFPASMVGNGADIQGIGLQSNGQIVVSGDFGHGQISTGGYSYAGVARLNTDGSFDTTFGSGGLFLDPTLLTPSSLTVQPDDKILIAGRPSPAMPNANNAFVIDRITATGQADASFGSGGQSQVSFSGTTGADPWAIALGPDGKITVGGDASYSSLNRFAVARFLNDITWNTTTAATASLTTSRTVSAPLAPSSAAPANGPTVLALAPLVLDSPDLWEAFLPVNKRHGVS